MQGRIIKGIAGFYYVHTDEGSTYACRARGIFRRDGQKPLVGDLVRFQVVHEADMEGNIEEIFPRKNQLVRPAAANVDQAVIIFAMNQPKPNFMLLDRFLVAMERQGIPTVICINKMELGSEEERRQICGRYGGCGYRVLLTSAARGDGIDDFREVLRGRTSVMAGPSGVGKSSLTNLVRGEDIMETGEISRKLRRGRHTTRHAQLIALGDDTYIMDTPGFSSLYAEDMEKEELREYFIEFHPYEGTCRFQGCAHIHEPDCSVKEALAQGIIDPVRYANYVELYNELKEKHPGYQSRQQKES